MKNNRIVIGTPTNPLFEFTNDQLRQVDVVMRSSFSGDELAYDQLNGATFAGEPWDLISNELYDLYSNEDYQLVSSPANLTEEIPAETAIRYYIDNVLMGKFYAMPAERENMLVYDVMAVSAVGLLVRRPHKGGLYNGTSFADVAAEIIGGAFPFSCSATVSLLQIYGWLPYNKDARENLHQLLFATGVMVYKDANGDVYFDFANTALKHTVPDDNVYVDGTITAIEHATMVRVTEHSFVALPADQEYTLFDNSSQTSVSNLLVTFSQAPIHDLTATGSLQIIESGVNYAVVSGNGTLTGKAYTHIQQIVEVGTSDGAILEFNQQTLVNQLNSINVANRLANYYGVTQRVDTAIQSQGEKSGDRIAFTGPYKEAADGYITEMTITGLATAKARCSILTNFTPTQGGNNYEHRDIISTNASWTVPAGVTSILAVLIGGGSGGYGGSAGANGAVAGDAAPGVGGSGGLAGPGGSAGKVIAQRISVTPGQTFNAVIGAGGAGGEASAYGAEQNAGAEGGATTFAGYSSANGTVPDYGFVDLIGGQVYAMAGGNGTDGGKGGQGMTAYTAEVPYIVVDGKPVTYNGVTYPGGRSNPTVPDGQATVYGTDGRGHFYSYGGGSGAVAGYAGNPSENGYISSRTIYGGKGANAPTPVTPAAATNYGSGGAGGNGGGGGGGAGAAGNEHAQDPYAVVLNQIGYGSSGSVGGIGAPGAVFVYY